MTRPLTFFLLPALLTAESWQLEKLYTRPYVWGTSPTEITWSKQGHTLLFLWNAEGNRFRDLYAYHPAAKKLVRLTNLESVHDDINRTEAEKDDRLKQYLMPPEGIAAFQMSRDGNRATFDFQGDISIVPTDQGRAGRAWRNERLTARAALKMVMDGKELHGLLGSGERSPLAREAVDILYDLE